MILEIFNKNRMGQNSYLLMKNNSCICIDPGFNSENIIEFIKNKKLKLDAILLTHAHFDHIGKSFEIARQFDVKIFLHEQEKDVLYNGSYAKQMNYDFVIEEKYICTFNTNNLQIKDFEFQVNLFPGHTKGGVVYKIENKIFVGDMIFIDSIGRTDLIYSNKNDLKISIKSFLNIYHSSDVIYPGHGNFDTLASIKKHNVFLSNFNW
jgi:glyoxylase-like metal-dependent hydrolase (beta-lactamase superfamily II)